MVTGHIRKRKTKDGKASWQIILELGKDPVTGKRLRKHETVDGTKKEAEALLNQLKFQSQNGGVIVRQSSQKLCDWMDDWLRLYNAHLSPTTITGYRYQIDNRIKPQLGRTPLKALNSNQIQAWVNALSRQGLSGKTVKNTFLNLSAALDKAEELQMIERNPCKHIVLPSVKKYSAQVYTMADVQNILKLARGTDMYFLLTIEFYLGLRKGEVSELKWSDIDLEGGIVHITRSRVETDDGIIVKSTKSEAGIRDIPLSDRVLTVFKKQYAEYLNKIGKNGFVDSGYVICKNNGEPFVPGSIPQRWDRFCNQHKLRKIRFHDLRHTCATLMIANGTDPKTVQAWLGHSDIQVTLNTYAHCLPSMKQAAGDRMDVIFGS